ncbi:MAG: hypothetical protein FD126_3730 [Elusimicrobia bacterium]|nr:MAG: hypothetical protein FD126_3730 [Elusimicrobiota bacterium]
MTTPSPETPAAEAFKGKTILIVNSGPLKKRFIFQKLKGLGVGIVLLNKENNWAARYADAHITADPLRSRSTSRSPSSTAC